MYLAFIPIDTGHDLYVFLWDDPRPHCPYRVTDGVEFVDLIPQSDEWGAGGETPPHVLGRLKRDPTKFKALRSDLDVSDSWEIFDGSAEVWNTWKALMATNGNK